MSFPSPPPPQPSPRPAAPAPAASSALPPPPGMRPAHVLVPPRTAPPPPQQHTLAHPSQSPQPPQLQLQHRPVTHLTPPAAASLSPSPTPPASVTPPIYAAPALRPTMPSASPPPPSSAATHAQWQPRPQQPPHSARWQPAAVTPPLHSPLPQPQLSPHPPPVGLGNQSAPVHPAAFSWQAAAAPAHHAPHHQPSASYSQMGSVTPHANSGMMHQRGQSMGFPQAHQPMPQPLQPQMHQPAPLQPQVHQPHQQLQPQPRNPYSAAILSPQHSVSPPALGGAGRHSPWMPGQPSPSPSPAPAVPYNQPSPFGGSQSSTPYGSSPYAAAAAASSGTAQLRKRAMHGGLAGSDAAEVTPSAGRTVYDFTEAAAASLRNASLYEPLGPTQRKKSLQNKGISCCTWVAICVLLVLVTGFGVWLHNPFGLFTHGFFRSRPPQPNVVRSMYASFEENPEVVEALRAQGDMHELAERKRAEEHAQQQQQQQTMQHETHPSAPAANVKPAASPSEREIRVGATPSGATPSSATAAAAVVPPPTSTPSSDTVTPLLSDLPGELAPAPDTVSPLLSDLPAELAPVPELPQPSKETLRIERKANLLRAVEDPEAHPLVDRDSSEHAVHIGTLDHELHTELSARKRGASLPLNVGSSARFQFTVLSPHTISLCLGESDNGRNVIVVGNSQARAIYFQLLNTLLLARGLPLQPTTRKAQHDLCAPLQLRNHFRVHDLTAQTLEPSCPQVLPRLSYYFVSELYDPVMESIFASNASLILLAGIGMVDVLDSSKVISEAHSLAVAQAKLSNPTGSVAVPGPNAVLSNMPAEWQSLMEERRADLGALVAQHVSKGCQVVSMSLPPVCTSKLHRLHSTEPLEAQEQTFRGTRLSAELEQFNTAMRDIILGAGGSVFDAGSYVPSLYLFPAPRPNIDFCPLYDDALHAGVLLRKVWVNNLANLLCKNLKYQLDRILGGSLSVEAERRAIRSIAAREGKGGGAAALAATLPRCWHHRRSDSFTKGDLIELEDNNIVQILPINAHEAVQAAAEAAAAANTNAASMPPLTPTPAVVMPVPPRRSDFSVFSSSDALRCLSEQYLPAVGGTPSEVGAPMSSRHPIVFVGGANVRALYFAFVNLALGANHTERFDESAAAIASVCVTPPPETFQVPYAGRGAAPVVPAGPTVDDNTPLVPSCPVVHSSPIFGLVQFVWHTGPFLGERGLPLRVLEMAPQAVVAMGSPTPGPQARPEAHRGGGMLAHAMRHHLQSGRQWVQLTIPPLCAAAAKLPELRPPTQGGRGQHHKAPVAAGPHLRAGLERNRALAELNRALDGLVVSSGGSVMDLGSFLPPPDKEMIPPPGRPQQPPPQQPQQRPPPRPVPGQQQQRGAVHGVVSPPMPPPIVGGSACAAAYEDDQIPSLAVRTEMATALWNLLCVREIKRPFYFKKGDQLRLK